MPLSQYCRLYPQKKTADSYILFSTKRASIVEANRPLLDAIERGRLSKKEKNTLSELGLITDDPLQERLEMLHSLDKMNSLSNIFKAYVALNLDCNLACKYCFEGQRKGKFYMTRQTADLFVDFVKNNFIAGKKEIVMVFYGGEPLLSVELIAYISERLKAYADAEGIGYEFSLITNGTLLTRRNVEMLRPMGLSAASITLDGPRSIHNAFRPFKTGKGSFDLIFRNARDVSGMIDVEIGGNYTRKTYRNFPELLDYLNINGLYPGNLSNVRFDFVTGESKGIGPPDFHDGVVSLNEPWLYDAVVHLRKEILKRGYRTQRLAPMICMMEYKDAMVVNFDGSIYKCPGLIGRSEFKVGHVKSGIGDYRESHNLGNWKNEDCLSCCYLPLCFGGCRYMKLVREGEMEGVDCKKPYFDACLEALVKQDMRYGVRAGDS